MGHINGDLEGGGGSALSVPRLQHVKLAPLDGELDVLHVAVVPLEDLAHAEQLGIGLRHGAFEAHLAGLGERFGDRLGGADPGHHVLALGVDQIFPVEHVLAGRGVAGEADAGRAILAHVAKDHGLHIDRGAPIGGDVVQLAVGDGTRVHPAAEHGADRPPQLFMRVLREGLAGLGLHHLLVPGDHFLPVFGGERGVLGHAAFELDVLDDVLEAVMIDAEHHRAIHLDEAAVAVPGEAGITRGAGETFHRLVVEAEIEDGIHHARHGDPRPRADRDEEGAGGIAERLAAHLLEPGERGAHLLGEAFGIGAVMGVEVGADLGGDGKARRHGKADRRHLGEIGALAPQKLAHLGAALVQASPEIIDPLLHRTHSLALDLGKIGETVHGLADTREQSQTIVA